MPTGTPQWTTCRDFIFVVVIMFYNGSNATMIGRFLRSEYGPEREYRGHKGGAQSGVYVISIAPPKKGRRRLFKVGMSNKLLLRMSEAMTFLAGVNFKLHMIVVYDDLSQRRLKLSQTTTTGGSNAKKAEQAAHQALMEKKGIKRIPIPNRNPDSPIHYSEWFEGPQQVIISTVIEALSKNSNPLFGHLLDEKHGFQRIGRFTQKLDTMSSRGRPIRGTRRFTVATKEINSGTKLEKIKFKGTKDALVVRGEVKQKLHKPRKYWRVKWEDADEAQDMHENDIVQYLLPEQSFSHKSGSYGTVGRYDPIKEEAFTWQDELEKLGYYDQPLTVGI